MLRLRRNNGSTHRPAPKNKEILGSAVRGRLSNPQQVFNLRILLLISLTLTSPTNLALASGGMPINFMGARPLWYEGSGIITRFKLINMSDSRATQMSSRMVSLMGIYGLTRDVNLILMLPYVDKEMEMSMGRKLNTSGLADVNILAKYRFFRKDGILRTTQLAVSFGLKLPTGSSKEKHQSDGRLDPRAMQLGSGSYDFSFDIAFTRETRRWGLHGNSRYKLTTEGDYDYQYGSEFQLNLLTGYRLYPEKYPGKEVYLLLEINAKYAARDEDRGIPVEDSGGKVVFVSPGLQFVPENYLVAELSIQLPVIQELYGDQMASHCAVNMGIRFLF